MNTHYLKAEFNVGKNGLTENLIQDIKEKLKKKKIIKIKFLPSIIKGKDKDALFHQLAKETNTKIVKKIGFTIVLKYEGH
jgi:RNA-binding protein